MDQGSNLSSVESDVFLNCGWRPRLNGNYLLGDKGNWFGIGYKKGIQYDWAGWLNGELWLHE